MNAAQPTITNEQSDITLQTQNKGDHPTIIPAATTVDHGLVPKSGVVE